MSQLYDRRAVRRILQGIQTFFANIYGNPVDPGSGAFAIRPVGSTEKLGILMGHPSGPRIASYAFWDELVGGHGDGGTDRVEWEVAFNAGDWQPFVFDLADYGGLPQNSTRRSYKDVSIRSRVLKRQ